MVRCMVVRIMYLCFVVENSGWVMVLLNQFSEMKLNSLLLKFWFYMFGRLVVVLMNCLFFLVLDLFSWLLLWFSYLLWVVVLLMYCFFLWKFQQKGMIMLCMVVLLVLLVNLCWQQMMLGFFVLFLLFVGRLQFVGVRQLGLVCLLGKVGGMFRCLLSFWQSFCLICLQ